jgi:hypothetical protein
MERMPGNVHGIRRIFFKEIPGWIKWCGASFVQSSKCQQSPEHGSHTCQETQVAIDGSMIDAQMNSTLYTNDPSERDQEERGSRFHHHGHELTKPVWKSPP